MQKIKKINVATGVYWLEIQEVGLFILCGCPADSVKYLMKRGLIVTVEENGLTYESGPNIILLSDLMIQNGDFANLAEFPVLQMFYNQGMILPNHPKNTGIKPLIMGSIEQVNAQMQYIYRGNYGLVTKEEIMGTGVSAGKAQEMMIIKKKFAFGKIAHPKELLDTLIIDSEPVEIRNQVSIQRLRMNVFQLTYQDEKVTVDLNLPKNNYYESPYPLGFHNIKRDYFAVIHSGQGDGWDINRPSMASILLFQGKIYLIDAGPSIKYTLLALGIGVNEIEGIFHTHSHDDHLAGLTTLIRAGHRIKYYATPLIQAAVSKKLSALLSIEEEEFYQLFEVHDLQFDSWNNIEGLEVKPIFSPHPVETSIFIFRALWDNGYRTYAHLADTVSKDVLKTMIKKNNDDVGIDQIVYDKVIEDYLQPADLKKIDIGGGLIHGNAEDFIEDQSKKIILSHTAKDFTQEQKKIGSGAPFGIVDVLIPGKLDYVRNYADDFLSSYFPDAPVHQLRILLNNEVITLNPETLIIKEGEINQNIYLILAGNVEMIQSGSNVQSILSAGALVGELSGLYQIESPETYRAISYVKALLIPTNLYFEFVKKNHLISDIEHLHEKRVFLQKTWLFGESISYEVQNRLAQKMHLLRIGVGQFVSKEDYSLYVIKRGKLQRLIENEVFETLSNSDFFKEETAIFNTPSICSIKVLEPTEVYQIPGEIIRDIPIVRWKLLETYEKRLSLILNVDLDSIALLKWREEYSIHVQRMDNQHIKMFEIAKSLFEALDSKKGKEILENILNHLIQYAQFHFQEEEKLLERYHYSEYKHHHKLHNRLMNQILEFQDQFRRNDYQLEVDFLDFFKSWLINHILIEDRKYGQYLNQKKIF